MLSAVGSSRSPETPLPMLKLVLSATALAALLSTAQAQAPGPLKVGLMLPATSTPAALGTVTGCRDAPVPVSRA